MKSIKRYPNRKLYDLDRKRYVTLDDIAFMIQEGADVKVVDHETGEDLTSITLSQIIFEREKKRSGFLPQAILMSLVRTGGDTLDYLRRSLHSSLGALRVIETEIDSRIDLLVAKGEMAQEEADRVRREISESILSAVHERLPDFRIEAALERLNVPSRRDVDRLQSRVDELARIIETLLQESDPAEKSDGA